MNTENENETLDYDQHAAEARERMRTVIAGLEEAYAEDHSAQLAAAIIKAQEKLDHYCGFKEARALLPDTPSNRVLKELQNL